MATQNLDQVVTQAVELLPDKGQTIEFNEYKAKLYEAYPESGQAAFAHMIKKDIILKAMGRDAEGKIIVLLARK